MKSDCIAQLECEKWQRWTVSKERDKEMFNVTIHHWDNKGKDAEWIQKQRVSGAGATVLR